MKKSWHFSARIQYPSANRGYEVSFSSEYKLTIWDQNSLTHERGLETGYWGPNISVEAKNLNQTCWVSFGLPTFMDALLKAVEALSNLSFEDSRWEKMGDASSRLERKSAFIRHVIEHYPALFSELEKTFAAALEQVRHGKKRVASLTEHGQ